MHEAIGDEQRDQWPSALKAGVAYFGAGFGFGFLLGTFRILVLVPAIGEIFAVLLEVPIILAISWFSSRWLIKQFSVRDRLVPRLVMGGLAFVLLMVGEAVLSIFVFGRTPGEHLASYRSAASIIGLLGQLAFASFPAIQLARKYTLRRRPVLGP